ncbi:MAG TPA: DNA methyltransferase [Phycisphaerales bacterium]|nr:DNA methyltransferase [Phycisphaerales bacterium]
MLQTGTKPAAKRNRGTNGDANKLSPADRAIHDWYRFVLSFPPHLVQDYLKRFQVEEDQTVLDPFCGTGTTVVECKKRGISAIGVEAHPMAHLAGLVKTDWTVDPDELLEHANIIARETADELARDQIDDDKDCATRVDLEKLKHLSVECAGLLLSRSISPLPLHKTLVLLGRIQARSGSQCHKYELLALAKALVSVIGNLHFGPEVGVGPPKRDVPVLSSWLRNIELMAEDLVKFGPLWSVPSSVIRADARELVSVIRSQSVDAVITSPPYPNEKDYTRTTRLESVILGLIRTKGELKAFKRTLLRSNTRNVYKGDSDDQWIRKNRDIREIADRIEARRVALNKTSGFERLYPRVTKLYFGGMARHLAGLRDILKPGARLAYVVGDQASYLRVMIRTGSLLADIASELGYEVLGMDLFRTRLATATKEQLREEVLLLRWPGKE